MTADVAAIVASDRENDSIIAIVREWSPARRQSAIVEIAALIPTDSALGNVLPVILSAPTGPDPAAVIIDRIVRAVDGLAAFSLGATESVESFDGLTADDVAAMFANALERVTPMTAENVAAMVAPTPAATAATKKRTRRNIPRDHSRADGMAFVTLGRPGITPPSMVTIHCESELTPGHPVNLSFVTPDGERFPTLTNAIQHCDGWGEEKNGWKNPYDHCIELRPTGNVARTVSDICNLSPAEIAALPV